MVEKNAILQRLNGNWIQEENVNTDYSRNMASTVFVNEPIGPGMKA